MYCKWAVKYLILLTSLQITKEVSNPLRSSLRLHHIKCRSNNTQLAGYKVCQIQRNNNESKLQTLCHIAEPFQVVHVRFQCMRRQRTEYVPFVINVNIDWCDFMEKRNHNLLEKVFRLFYQSSNLDRKCPISTGDSFVNFSIPNNGIFDLPFKFPQGDYRLDSYIYANRAVLLTVNIFFQIQ